MKEVSPKRISYNIMQISPLLPSFIMRSRVSESFVRDSSGICSSLVCSPSLISS